MLEDMLAIMDNLPTWEELEEMGALPEREIQLEFDFGGEEDERPQVL